MDSWILIPLVGSLALGLVFGTTIQRRHYASIRKREAESFRIPVLTLAAIPGSRVPAETTLAVGSVVISIDAFKKFLAGLRMLLGGELPSYAGLIDRARREALLRMKESVPDADLFVNYRIETASVFNSGESTSSVEVVAYSTAIRFADEVRP